MKRQVSAGELILSFLKRPENWASIITLPIAVMLGFRSLTTGDINNYLQAVLLVLGLLALSHIAVGYSSMLRDREIEELSSAIDSLGSGLLSADLFFITRSDLPPLEMRLSDAEGTVDILGLSLSNVSLTHWGILRNLKSSGVKLRLIVSNPDNQSVQEAIARRILEVETAHQHAQIVRSALENLKRITCQSREGEGLEVRITDEVPSFSYVGIDAASSNGQIYVELYLSKVPVSTNPVFVLRAETEPLWYDEFRAQFEHFWSHATKPNSDSQEPVNS